MTYNPDSSESHALVDITQTISSSLTPADSGFKQQLKNLRISSGETHGELELPEVAPLIFPGLDEVAMQSEEANKVKKGREFVADYFDRRAQATYVCDPDRLFPQLM
jgi:hypothetical protein